MDEKDTNKNTASEANGGLFANTPFMGMNNVLASSVISEITCGRLPRTMPDGRVSAADYYYLEVFADHAELTHCKGSLKESYMVNGMTALVALEKVKLLTEKYPDEKPFHENLPLAKDIIFKDGTVKYAPQEELSRILTEMIPMIINSSCMPQGLVAAMPPPNMPANTLQMPNTPAGTDTWKCECGYVNSGKFCANCGSPKQ